MRSTNGGSTWSHPINIMNNGANPAPYANDQFMPAITVNEEGNRISISFFDRSDFVNNDSMNTKIVTWINGGLTFTQPVRV